MVSDKTENVLWRLQHGEVDGIAPKVMVLLVGTNNTGHRQEGPLTTAKGVRRVVQELRERLPTSRILLLGIFPREEPPTAQLRQMNDRINGLISALADGDRVTFLNVNDSLMNADGSLSNAFTGLSGGRGAVATAASRESLNLYSCRPHWVHGAAMMPIGARAMDFRSESLVTDVGR